MIFFKYEKKLICLTDVSASATQYWHHDFEVKREETCKRTKYLEQLENNESKSSDQHFSEKDICHGELSAGGDQDNYEAGAGKELEQEVKLWSDFLRTRFHPKTNVIVNDFHHNNTAEPFDIFGYGNDAWNNGTYAINDEFEDRIRFFVEESDSLKGFQMMTDGLTGFGGISANIGEYIKDEFGSQCLLAFPVIPCISATEKFNPTMAANEVLNLALTLKTLADTSSLVTPMSLSPDTFRLKRSGNHRQFPGFSNGAKFEEDYHSSAVLSLAMNTLSLPWRLLRGAYASPYEVSIGLNAYGRKIASLELIAPFPKPIYEKLNTYLKSLEPSDRIFQDYQIPISPHADLASFNWHQSVATRGISGTDACNLDFLEFYSKNMPQTSTSVITSNNGIQVGLPFPHHIIETTTPFWDSKSKIIPTMTSWNSNPTSGSIAKTLSERLQKIKLAKMHRFQDAGLEQEEYEAVVENLTVLSECYQKPSDVM